MYPSRGAPQAQRPAYGGNSNNRDMTAIRERVQERLLTALNLTVSTGGIGDIRVALEQIFGEIVIQEQLPLSRAERQELFEEIAADLLGYGPLEPLLQDDSVSEIMVNGPDHVYIERKGLIQETETRFRDTDELMRIIERIVAPLGRRVDESSPMVDARLPDGSRVNVVIPPLALNGPCMSIRKFSRTALTANDLVQFGTLTAEMSLFLRACVLARLNIVVSGGTSSGKTSLLNVLSSFLPPHERIITIEDSAELRLNQRHVVRLEARPPNVEGRGQVGIRQLVINALRMRPDRIIVGEVRGGEALDMLQAMNTGHDGSLTTAHSNSPRDTLHRVETMVLMAGAEMPLRAIREQISAAFDVILHVERLSDGSRKVVKISEVQGMEGDIVVMQDVFQFVQTGLQDGAVQGYFTAMGVRPRFVDRFEALGINLPPDLFAPARASLSGFGRR